MVPLPVDPLPVLPDPVVIFLLALQLIVVPLFVPPQLQFHGPFPAKFSIVPVIQRLMPVETRVLRELLFALPHEPFTGVGAEALSNREEDQFEPPPPPHDPPELPPPELPPLTPLFLALTHPEVIGVKNLWIKIDDTVSFDFILHTVFVLFSWMSVDGSATRDASFSARVSPSARASILVI